MSKKSAICAVIMTCCILGMVVCALIGIKEASVTTKTRVMACNHSEVQNSSAPQFLESPAALNVGATAYNPDAGQTDATPHQTATLTKAKPGKTMACSRDLMPRLLGKRVYVEGMGVWVVEDLMNGRITNTVDFCVGNAATARQFERKNVTLHVLEN